MPQDPIIYFDTKDSADLFHDADVNGHFWSLCRYFVSERFMTYCGVATGTMLLNSLGAPAPDSPQIFPYKMFTQDNIFTDAVLHVRRPRDVERDGNTLDQLADMLGQLDVEVETLHGDELDLGRFRSLTVDVLRSPKKRLAVDFDRRVLGQKGSGHFSPVAAYHSEADRFLIMDVARYKLPPCWATARDLCAAIQTIDPVSEKARGLLVVSRTDPGDSKNT
jgi:hypothetical protein